MKFYIALLFISFNVISLMKIEENYSIYDFLGEIQNNGIFNLLRNLMNDFGVNVAIKTCLKLYNSDHCERTVRVFISVTSTAPDPTSIPKNSEDPDDLKEMENLSEEEKRENLRKMASLINDYNGPSDIKRKLVLNIPKIAKEFKGIFKTTNN